jgi:hypothetical protein
MRPVGASEPRSGAPVPGVCALLFASVKDLDLGTDYAYLDAEALRAELDRMSRAVARSAKSARVPRTHGQQNRGTTRAHRSKGPARSSRCASGSADDPDPEQASSHKPRPRQSEGGRTAPTSPGEQR